MIQMGPVQRVHVPMHIIIYTLPIERLAKIKEIEDSTKEKKEKLKTKLTFTVQLLADAYDR